MLTETRWFCPTRYLPGGDEEDEELRFLESPGQATSSNQPGAKRGRSERIRASRRSPSSITSTSSASLFPVGVTTGREPRRSRRTVITSGSSAAPIRTAATSLRPDVLRSLSTTSSEQGEDDQTAEAPGTVSVRSSPGRPVTTSSPPIAGVATIAVPLWYRKRHRIRPHSASTT